MKLEGPKVTWACVFVLLLLPVDLLLDFSKELRICFAIGRRYDEASQRF